MTVVLLAILLYIGEYIFCLKWVPIEDSQVTIMYCLLGYNGLVDGTLASVNSGDCGNIINAEDRNSSANSSYSNENKFPLFSCEKSLNVIWK